MKTRHLASMIVLLPALAIAAGSSFFSFSTPWPQGESGKWVTMKIEEVDRTDSTSVVEVSGASRDTDSTAAFLLGGMCRLAKARGQRYFQAREIDSDPLTFEVTFPKTAPNSAVVPLSAIAPNVFPVSHCS